uniref:Ras-GEF domain-containing protein n=1 Tax=Graphocephala atropunctata TaxID=36148 RepID=A0A1B6LRM7_9HEMI
MDDTDIQETVESILGKGVKVVDCEKKSCVKEEEVLLVNGCPIKLEGEDGAAIREALLHGTVPHCDLLNQILVRAGILRAPVRLETSLSVKSSVVTREEVSVSRGGQVVDERSRETKEDNFYTSTTSEVWEPVGVIPNPNSRTKIDSTTSTSGFPQDYSSSSASSSRPNSDASTSAESPLFTSSSHMWKTPTRSSTSSEPRKSESLSTTSSHSPTTFTDSEDQPDFACANSISNGLRGLTLTGEDLRGPSKTQGGGRDLPHNSGPTIFGTVASDLTPKEGGNCRRSLPQTTVQGGVTNGGGATDHDPSPEPAADYDNALVYRDGNLVSGSLDALIQHMVPTTDYYPDRAYLFAFLLSSRLFIKPHELLGRVTALCDSQQKLSDKQPPAKERLSRFIPRLVQLMAEWSETFPYDFRDERVMAHVRSITQSCVSVVGAAGEERVRREVATLLQNLLHRLTALEKYEEFLQRVNAESTTSNIESLNMTDVTDLCPNTSALAQQLTHIELERLSFIGPEEFVQAFAKDNPHLETSFKDMKKTRNLESYVSWFNRLSYFVATEVVKHAKKKQRVRVVEFWIETARECFNIGNFNSLMAIIAGLNMSPISRLKKTWNKVQSAKFSVLEHQMDPSSNFCNYRSTLKAAMWRSAGATDQSQRIVIPFFSLLVKDLYFLNEGCSNKLPNGHINFEKFWQLAKQVTEFITWKQVTCPFEKNPKVITFLQASPVLTENALALASFECEPPDNSLEKERCKSLKTWYAEMNCKFCQIEAYKRQKELRSKVRQQPLNTAMPVYSDVLFQFNILHSEAGEPGVQPPHLETALPVLPIFDPLTTSDFFSILAEMTS